MKICSKCKAEKDESEFRIKQGKLYYQCKYCEHLATKEWRQKNKAHVKEYKRQYEKNHPELTKEIKKRERERNKYKYAERSKKWVVENPGKRKSIQRKYRDTNHEKCKSSSRISAKKAYDLNPIYFREKRKKWRIDNIDKAKEMDNKRVFELYDSYLIKCLCLQGYSKDQILQTPVLLAVKKINLLSRRFKKLQNKKS